MNHCASIGCGLRKGLELLDWIIVLFCSLTGFCGEEACREVTHLQQKHLVCSYRTADVSVRLSHLDTEGKPYASLSNFRKNSARKPQLLMNGGMYHDDLAPVGLYVEAGKQSQKISTKGGWGNFHLLPNGVFWSKGGKLGVTETKTFQKRKIKPEFATQSGPMLVIKGKLHPKFLENSDSTKIRNGVGVSADGRWVHFAISRGFVNFWNFGTLFRDVLKTPNALFLDGTVSAIDAGRYRQGGWRELGPIIGVFEKAAGSQNGIEIE